MSVGGVAMPDTTCHMLDVARSGEPILDGVGFFGLEPVEVLPSPLATHVRYRRAS